MKSNAIVRIVIWSVVILVLLAVLIAGLANNLFTVFHGNTIRCTTAPMSQPPSLHRVSPILPSQNALSPWYRKPVSTPCPTPNLLLSAH